MRRQSKHYLLALGFLLGVTSSALGRGTFTVIDFPGASYTKANGISPSGNIIGDYAATLTGSGPHHGFVLSRDGVFTTIDYPGATSTFAWGVNSHGDIVGTYTFADNVSHIFVMSANQFSANGQFIAIDDLPAALSTVLIAIHAIHGGEIVGTYQSADKVGHGFVMSDGQVTTVDGPGGPTFTDVTGIDSRGEIVGRYMVNGVTHAFLLSGGQYNTFDYPGATNYTAATAISPNGDLVGVYRDANNVSHGFLLVGFRLACVSSGS
jgi:uncharacterized membrane protein